MTKPTKDFCVKFCTCHCLSKHELCYHAHCLCISGLFANMGGIVVTVRDGMGVGNGRRRIRRGKMGKGIYLHGQHVTEARTNCCVFV